MNEVFKVSKVNLVSGTANLPIYIVSDASRNMTCLSVDNDFFSEAEADRIAEQCNKVLDSRGTISMSLIEKIAREVKEEYLFNHLKFIGLADDSIWDL